MCGHGGESHVRPWRRKLCAAIAAEALCALCVEGVSMIRRKLYLDKLEMYLNRDVVKIITGVKRCGKTTLVLQFIDELKAAGVPEENIIYINFESLIYSYFTKSSQLREMLIEFVNAASGHVYIFLDEVQGIENWAEVASEFINLFDCDVYVTASDSSVFGFDFAKILSYRYIRIEVYPFTFGEYLDLKAAEDEAAANEAALYGGTEAGRYLNHGNDPYGGAKTAAYAGNGYGSEADPMAGQGIHASKTKEEHFRDYLRFGFMPGIYSLKNPEQSREYLSNLYGSIILDNVVRRGNLRDIAHIDKIMEYIYTHMGEVYSPKTIKDYIKDSGVIISVDTVYSILEALSGAYIIYKIPRFDIKSDRKLETQEKYYACDIAMRNALVRDNGLGLEASIENALCIEMLQRGFRLYVGKQGKHTVDFMAMRGKDRTYINCAVSVADKDAAKKEFGVLTRIKDNYFKMVLSMDTETIVNKGGIINYPIVGFLSEN